MRVLNLTPWKTYSQENIFKPLGLKMSFYLTPELQQHLLPLVHRTGDGKLEAWANQAKVIEREVAKGEHAILMPSKLLSAYI